MKLEVATVNKDFAVGLIVPNKMATHSKLPPINVHTRIDKGDPKDHILHLYPDLFDGVGTMENVLVHLDGDKNIEPVVHALRKIPHYWMKDWPVYGRNPVNAKSGKKTINLSA